MSTMTEHRDYSIIGEANLRARADGLVNAEWYVSPITRQRLKDLTKRKDGPALLHTLIWAISLIGIGYLAYLSWGTWWAVPAFALYGIVYVTKASSMSHECSHGTAFKSPWLNVVVYQITAFMGLSQRTNQSWSHSRHHSDTIIVGSDPEIVTPRPPVWRVILTGLFFYSGAKATMKQMFLRTFGRLSDSDKSYIPKSEHAKVFWEARITLLSFLLILVLCFYTRSLLPAMFVGLPLIYGVSLIHLIVMTQHLGLHEDVLDHRLNTRTFLSNAIIRFLYTNMNYHVEHHMFPMVPFHALPALHEELKRDFPAASPSFLSALKEVIAALRKQRYDPGYIVLRKLPDTAQPYYYGPSEV